jgi:hypothetical protein
MQANPSTSLSLDEAARAAMQALEVGRADRASPYVDALMAAAPQHEVVRRLNLYRRVMAIEEPAERQLASLNPRIGVTQDKIDLVAFHVDLPAAPSGIHGQINYTDVLRLAFQSARLRAPRSRRIILTDEATAFPDDIGADEIRRFAIDSAAIMYERTRSQVAYLDDLEGDRSCVLMDSDIVVNRDPVEAFQLDFDVGLTWRTGFPDAPFNGGLILIADARKGRSFMARVLECYERLAVDPRLTGLFDRSLKGWWGDQYALAIMVGYRAFGERTCNAMTIDGIRTGFLPCADYNVTLEPNQNYGRDELRRKYFVHFKGNRKAMLGEYVKLMAANAL